MCFRDTVPEGFSDGSQLPVEARDGRTLRVHAGPRPTGGRTWAVFGLARREGAAEARFECTVNGRRVGEPTRSEYVRGLGGDAASAVRASCPLDVLRDGINEFGLRQTAGAVGQQVVWAELRFDPRPAQA